MILVLVLVRNDTKLPPIVAEGIFYLFAFLTFLSLARINAEDWQADLDKETDKLLDAINRATK